MQLSQSLYYYPYLAIMNTFKGNSEISMEINKIR